MALSFFSIKITNKFSLWPIVGVLVFVISAFFYFDLDSYISWAEFNRHREFLEELCSRHPFLAKGVYFLIYLLAASISLPAITLFTLVGGALFGVVWGVILASSASTLGATIAFLIVRFLLRDFFHIKFKKDAEIFLEKFERGGAWYLLSLRLVPVMPYFLTNILMGFTNLPVRVYALISQLGMLPATLVYVNAGSRLSQVENSGDFISLPLIISFFLLALFPLLMKKLLEHFRKS